MRGTYIQSLKKHGHKQHSMIRLLRNKHLGGNFELSGMSYSSRLVPT